MPMQSRCSWSATRAVVPLPRQLPRALQRAAWDRTGVLGCSVASCAIAWSRPVGPRWPVWSKIDETEISCPSKNDTVTGGGGRSHQGKMLIVSAVEVQDGGAGSSRALGVYHGLCRKHLQSYLDEFVFRFNRRRTWHAAFRRWPPTPQLQHVDLTGSKVISARRD
jgi:hypothetical protein